MFPVIDYSLLHTDEECLKLKNSMESHGFLYVKNTGVDVEPLLLEALSFFSLSSTDKDKVAMIHSPHFRGYTRVATEITNGEKDYREQFDIGRDDVAVESPLYEWEQLQGPNLWPDDLPDMKGTITVFHDTLKIVGLRILDALADACGGGVKRELHRLYGNKPHEHLKLIRYPSGHSGKQGVGAHTDEGLLTVLFQTSQGLQVNIDGMWVDAPVIDGSFIVNIGELFSSVTGIKATEHRVICNESHEDRISVAFFLGGELAQTMPTDLESIERLATDTDNQYFRKIQNRAFIGHKYLKGRKRSHPDVAQKFYKE